MKAAYLLGFNQLSIMESRDHPPPTPFYIHTLCATSVHGLSCSEIMGDINNRCVPGNCIITARCVVMQLRAVYLDDTEHIEHWLRKPSQSMHLYYINHLWSYSMIHTLKATAVQNTNTPVNQFPNCKHHSPCVHI